MVHAHSVLLVAAGLFFFHHISVLRARGFERHFYFWCVEAAVLGTDERGGSRGMPSPSTKALGLK